MASINLYDPVNTSSPLNFGLLHWWMVLPGLEGSPHFYDLRANAHGNFSNITSQVWKPTNRNGAFGHLSFPGAFVDVPSSPTLQFTPGSSKTITAWVFDVNGSSTGTTAVVSKDGSTSREWALVFSNRQFIFLTFHSDSTTTQLTASSSYTSGQWNFVVCGYDAVSGKDFIRFNKNPKELSAAHSAMRTGTQPLSIGQSSFYLSNSSYIDDVRIYNRVLSDSELNSYYDVSTTGYTGVFNVGGPAANFVGQAALIQIGVSRLSKQMDLRSLGGMSPPVFAGSANLLVDYEFDNEAIYYPIVRGTSSLSKSAALAVDGYIESPIFSGSSNLIKVVRLNSDNIKFSFYGATTLEVRPVLIFRGKNTLEGFVHNGVLYLTEEISDTRYVTHEVQLNAKSPS